MKPAGLLQPISLPTVVCEEISMDFITGLPLSTGKTAILISVDRLSKYGHFIGLPPNFTSRKVAELFVRKFIRLHGFPDKIITDRDPIFLCEFWLEINKLQGTTLVNSSLTIPNLMVKLKHSTNV